MNYGGEGLSASDVAVLTGRTNNGDGGAFGDGNGAWQKSAKGKSRD